MGPKFKAALLLAVFGGLALFTGLRGYTVALIGSLLVLIAVSLAFLWNKYVFSKLTVERKLKGRQVEFDSSITMELVVTNRKILPLFGLKIEHNITPGLKVGEEGNLEVVKDGAWNIFRDYFHLNWYEKRRRVYLIEPLHRGRFEFAGSSLSYSDPFGIFTNEQVDVFPPTQLIVYPRIVPIKGIRALNTYLFGSRPREGWIFVDPLNKVGTRPYTSTDSARQINWKATARHIGMQVDVEKPAFDQEVYLILDQPPELAWWTNAVSNNLETAIMATASLIHEYTKAGYRIRLITNLVSKVHGTVRSWQGVPGRAQRSQLLTSLSLLQNFSVDGISKILQACSQEIKPGSTFVLLTTAPQALPDDLTLQLRRLQLKSRVAILRVGSDSDLVRTEGLKEWQIEGGRIWHEVSALELS